MTHSRTISHDRAHEGPAPGRRPARHLVPSLYLSYLSLSQDTTLMD